MSLLSVSFVHGCKYFQSVSCIDIRDVSGFVALISVLLMSFMHGFVSCSAIMAVSEILAGPGGLMLRV